MNEFSLNLPNYGITRFYVIGFVNLINNADLKIKNNGIEISSKTLSIRDLFTDAFGKVTASLQDYLEQSRSKQKIEIPASGNDGKIFDKIKSDMGLAKGSSFSDLFEVYRSHLTKISDTEFMQEMNGTGVYSAPSIFKPELYSLTRGPFFDGRRDSSLAGCDEKTLPLGGFLVRLGGYVVSRAGSAIIRGSKPPKYLKILVLPSSTSFTNWDFESVIRNVRRERLPGPHPEEGLIIWLALKLPEGIPDLIVVAMSDPAGMNPARIESQIYVPFNEYRLRAENFLGLIKEREYTERLKSLIVEASKEEHSTLPYKVIKRLFNASQGDPAAVQELRLSISKIIVDSQSQESQKSSPDFEFSKHMLPIVGRLRS